MDYDLWERLDHNPIPLLREINRRRLSLAAKDKDYLARLASYSLPYLLDLAAAAKRSAPRA